MGECHPSPFPFHPGSSDYNCILVYFELKELRMEATVLVTGIYFHPTTFLPLQSRGRTAFLIDFNVGDGTMEGRRSPWHRWPETGRFCREAIPRTSWNRRERPAWSRLLRETATPSHSRPQSRTAPRHAPHLHNQPIVTSSSTAACP